jgi:hypothetical protein
MGSDLPSVISEPTLPVQPTDAATAGASETSGIEGEEDGAMSILPVGDISTGVELASEPTGTEGLDLEEPMASSSSSSEVSGAEATDVPSGEYDETLDPGLDQAVGTAQEVAAPTSSA